LVVEEAVAAVAAGVGAEEVEAADSALCRQQVTRLSGPTVIPQRLLQ